MFCGRYIGKAYDFVIEEINFRQFDDRIVLSENTLNKINQIYRLSGFYNISYYTNLIKKLENKFPERRISYGISSDKFYYLTFLILDKK